MFQNLFGERVERSFVVNIVQDVAQVLITLKQ